MSFLDNLFTRSATPEIEIAEDQITADADIEAGFLYEVAAGGTDLELTLGVTAISAVAGKRIGVKVVGSAESPGDLLVIVPDGMYIEDDSGILGEDALIDGGRLGGNYREWMCDAAGVWLMVVGAAGGGGTAGPATQLAETSGPTTLSIAGVADGTFLKRVGTTVVGVGAPADISSELFAAPASPHANDREMITIPSGWTLYKFVAGLGVLTSPTVATINPQGSNSSGVPVINVPSARPSWLAIQNPPDNTTWFYGFKINAIGSEHVFRARINIPWTIGSIINNIANLKLSVLQNGAGNVPSINGAGSFVGFETDPSQAFMRAGYISGGARTTLVLGPDLAAGWTLDCEVAIIKTSGFYHLYVTSPMSSIRMSSVDHSGGLIDTGNPVWVGFEINCAGDPPVKIDYYRQLDTSAYWG